MTREAAHCRTGPTARAFTLVELLVAIALFVLIMLATTYVFSTSSETIGQSQGAVENMVRITAFENMILKDLKGIEHQGILDMGARHQYAYGSATEKEAGRRKWYRNDWLVLTVNSEQAPSVGGQGTGQWARVFYGHRTTADPQNWGFNPLQPGGSIPAYLGPDNTETNRYTPIGSNWCLIRECFVAAARCRQAMSSYANIDINSVSTYDRPDYRYARDVLCHVYRDFRWYGYFNYGWQDGLATLNYGPGGNAAVIEALYYHTLPVYTSDQRDQRALAGCSTFKVEYAMPADLRAGPDGGVLWRDPNPPLDMATATAANALGARKLFAPGDAWPALLKITVEVWDSIGRTPESQTASVVVKVP